MNPWSGRRWRGSEGEPDLTRSILGFSGIYVLSLAPFLSASPSATSVAFLLLAVTLIWISVEDLSRKIIPDAAVVATALLSLWLRALNHLPIRESLLVGGTLAFALWAIGEIYFRLRGLDGFGAGDAKLIGALTLLVGAETIWLTLFLAALAGIVAVLVANGRSARRGDAVPFGPFLAYAGFLLALVQQGICAR